MKKEIKIMILILIVGLLTVGCLEIFDEYELRRKDQEKEEESNSWTFVVEIPEDADENNFLFVVDEPDLVIEWGDGNQKVVIDNDDVSVNHVYDSAGIYEVTLTGTARALSFCSFYVGDIESLSNNINDCNVRLDTQVYQTKRTTPERLKDIITPIPASFGLKSAKNMFAFVNVESFTAENFFDEASGGVYDMSGMFMSTPNFNQDLNNWDVSNVGRHSEPLNIEMYGMFFGAKSFNGDITNWDVSNVSKMRSMFNGASSFNQDISDWDTSSLRDMVAMFNGASSFNQDISGWDVSNAYVDVLFFNATSFNQDLSSWCVDHINEKPQRFDEGATAWTQPRPIWGTCP